MPAIAPPPRPLFEGGGGDGGEGGGDGGDAMTTDGTCSTAMPGRLSRVVAAAAVPKLVLRFVVIWLALVVEGTVIAAVEITEPNVNSSATLLSGTTASVATFVLTVL